MTRLFVEQPNLQLKLAAALCYPNNYSIVDHSHSYKFFRALHTIVFLK